MLTPATYNTINTFRYGIADGIITTTLASALGRMEMGRARILMVPTMHGTMHNAILTESIKSKVPLQGFVESLSAWSQEQDFIDR